MNEKWLLFHLRYTANCIFWYLWQTVHKEYLSLWSVCDTVISGICVDHVAAAQRGVRVGIRRAGVGFSAENCLLCLESVLFKLATCCTCIICGNTCAYVKMLDIEFQYLNLFIFIKSSDGWKKTLLQMMSFVCLESWMEYHCCVNVLQHEIACIVIYCWYLLRPWPRWVSPRLWFQDSLWFCRCLKHLIMYMLRCQFSACYFTFDLIML